MIDDKELWACAHTVLTLHGARAPKIVAARIGALALANDADGVAVWKEIATRLNQLMFPEGATQ